MTNPSGSSKQTQWPKLHIYSNTELLPYCNTNLVLECELMETLESEIAHDHLTLLYKIALNCLHCSKQTNSSTTRMSRSKPPIFQNIPNRSQYFSFCYTTYRWNYRTFSEHMSTLLTHKPIEAGRFSRYFSPKIQTTSKTPSDEGSKFGTHICARKREGMAEGERTN